MIKTMLALFQAFLFLISICSGTNLSFKEDVDKMAIEQTSETDFTFDKITADDMKISQEEKESCRTWFDENVRFAGTNGKAPAYNLTLGVKKLSDNLGEWEFITGEESTESAVRKGGKTTYITVKSKKSDITLTVEATIYEKYATCEWTVYVKNTGKGNSPVINNLCGADIKLPAKNPVLYVSHGSSCDNFDFELYKSDVNTLPMIFTANGGRNSSFIPFFNISADNAGYVMSVGWTGQWYTSVSKECDNVRLVAKQQDFCAYLEENEQVRTPLISMCFYNVKNALKGFNILRNWETEYVYPESVCVSNGYVIANEFSTKTDKELIECINNTDVDVLKDVDYFWMDAGWYKYNEGWHDGVGNWFADTDRFPDTLKPVSEAMAQKGKKFLLWFEPERVRENTYLYNEAQKHDNWIVKIGDNLLWNLGDSEACDFLSQYIVSSMLTNGVGYYRQDFNFDPLEYWQKADRQFYSCRIGICENHYVTNLYKYLDTLLQAVDGLMIDNCASGGRRLDIEMTRRSIPLWRSDYNCGNADGTIKDDVLEATQAMTYGLSFWQTYSGTNRYFHSEYASRSAILTNQSVYEPDKNEFNKYRFISEYMTENYYPIAFGGTDMTKYLAMQFGDENDGAAVIYKRENVTDSTFVLTFNGLEPDNNYIVTNFDNVEQGCIMTGEQLMENGITLELNETPKAYIFTYTLA